VTADTGDLSGPIDFLMLSFDESSNDGSAGRALLDLIDRGVIALYDIRVIRKSTDGSVTTVDLPALPNGAESGFARFAGACSGLLTEDDVAEAADLMARRPRSSSTRTPGRGPSSRPRPERTGG
jgi:Family of unknown function (DUF6325)